MWILPSQLSPCAPESPVSISESDWRFQTLERSVTWRGKPSLAKSFYRAWKKGGWIRRLFGRMSNPSTAALGVASWISSLAVTRANLSASPESAEESTILGTYGPASPESSERSIPSPVSLKTSPAIYPSGSTLSPESFKQWAIGLRRVYSQRKKSAPLTRERGCLSSPLPTIESPRWGTPTTRDWKACKNANAPTNGLRGRQVVRWQTPTTTDACGRTHTYMAGDHNKPFLALPGQARLWPTTTASDWKGPNFSKSGTASTNGIATAAIRFLLDQTTQKDGKNTLSNGLVLSPRFTEALMGWPSNWTACAPVGTESSHNKPHSRSKP